MHVVSRAVPSVSRPLPFFCCLVADVALPTAFLSDCSSPATVSMTWFCLRWMLFLGLMLYAPCSATGLRDSPLPDPKPTTETSVWRPVCEHSCCPPTGWKNLSQPSHWRSHGQNAWKCGPPSGLSTTRHHLGEGGGSDTTHPSPLDPPPFIRLSQTFFRAFLWRLWRQLLYTRNFLRRLWRIKQHPVSTAPWCAVCGWHTSRAPWPWPSYLPNKHNGERGGASSSVGTGGAPSSGPLGMR